MPPDTFTHLLTQPLYEGQSRTMKTYEEVLEGSHQFPNLTLRGVLSRERGTGSSRGDHNPTVRGLKSGSQRRQADEVFAEQGPMNDRRGPAAAK